MNRVITFLLIPLLYVSVGGQNGTEAASQDHHTIAPLMRDGKPGARGKTGYEIVSGKPEVAGEPFVIRIHNYDNQILPPHWHPGDEHIVVVKGTWYLAHGDRWDRSTLREMNVGDYVFVPKNMRHYGISKGETVVQIHGIGPFKTVLADPWLYLSDPKSSAVFKFKENQTVRSARGEGVIRFGVHSEKNGLTQYAVEKKNGDVFFEFEVELESVKPDR